MKVHDVYLERSYIGHFTPITKEDFEARTEKDGSIAITNRTWDGTPWTVNIVFPCLAKFLLSESEYMAKCTEVYTMYEEYVRDITGIEYKDID